MAMRPLRNQQQRPESERSLPKRGAVLNLTIETKDIVREMLTTKSAPGTESFPAVQTHKRPENRDQRTKARDINQTHDQQFDRLWGMMKEIENKMNIAERVNTAQEMTIQLLKGELQERERVGKEMEGKVYLISHQIVDIFDITATGSAKCDKSAKDTAKAIRDLNRLQKQSEQQLEELEHQVLKDLSLVTTDMKQLKEKGTGMSKNERSENDWSKQIERDSRIEELEERMQMLDDEKIGRVVSIEADIRMLDTNMKAVSTSIHGKSMPWGIIEEHQKRETRPWVHDKVLQSFQAPRGIKLNDREPDLDAYLNELNDYFSRVAKNFDGLTFQILLEKRKSKGSLELVAGSFQSLLWSFLRQTVGTKLRENYLEYSEDCDALGQLLEMVTVTGTVVTVNNQVEWVATIFSKRFDDGQDMEEWISSRKRATRNLRAVKYEVTKAQNMNHLLMLLAGSTTYKAEVKAFKTQSNMFSSLDSIYTALMSAYQVEVEYKVAMQSAQPKRIQAKYEGKKFQKNDGYKSYRPDKRAEGEGPKYQKRRINYTSKPCCKCASMDHSGNDCKS